jgi:hypothetical protein
MAGVAVCGTIGGGAVPVIYYSYVSTIKWKKNIPEARDAYASRAPSRCRRRSG